MVNDLALSSMFPVKNVTVLGPLFFAYEDHTQIARFIVETFERLAAAAASVSSEKYIKISLLRELIAAFMSDFVTKKLKIQKGCALNA